MTGNHAHWVYYAYNRVEPTTGNFVESTTIDVIAGNEAEAEERVRELVPGKAHYYLTQVIEHLTDRCGR